jgi:hypothetical protein
MCPMRRDENGVRANPSWQSWIDEAIAEARTRGEFDNLPGEGRPLRIEENPFAGDWALALHVLENAGMSPPWMEMSEEIRHGLADLTELRDRTARYVTEQIALAQAPDVPPPAAEASPSRFRFRSWWPFRRPEPEPPGADAWRPSLTALEAERRRARRDYLGRAANLDEVIAAYNAWLPDNLRRLRKPRLSAAKAAEEFDAACPPILQERTPPED